MLRAVTAPLAGLYVAFQPEVIVCPAGSVKARAQPLTVEPPVLVMVKFSVRPVFQGLRVTATRHVALPDGEPDTGGLDAGGLDAGGLDAGGLDERLPLGLGLLPPLRPKNAIAAA